VRAPGHPVDALDPRASLEPFEELACLGKKRLRLGDLILGNEPLSVFEQGATEPERDAELAKRSGCPL
jgi:hypothetical protein